MELQGKFARAKGVIFTDYNGLTVHEMSELREMLRPASIDYKIFKNTLAKRACVGTPIDGIKDVFTGQTGIAFGYDDPVLLAKKILEFTKRNDKFKVRGGIIEGGVCSPEDIAAVSKLPSRQTLLAIFIGAMQSPLNKLAGALNATLSQFAYAMEALKSKKSVSD